jgi:hypothetical protein
VEVDEGLWRELRPRIHILDGEKVCIQRTRPAQLTSLLASRRGRRFVGGGDEGLEDGLSGSFLEAARASATWVALAATCLSGPGRRDAANRRRTRFRECGEEFHEKRKVVSSG